MGALDSNGIYIYDETDARDTFSELLNISQESVSDAILADRSRIGVIEGKFSASPVTEGPIKASSGWSATTNRGRTRAGLAFIDVILGRTGADIAIPGDGNVSDFEVATFNAGWVPESGVVFPAAPGSAGRMAGFRLSSTSVQVFAVVGTGTLTTGTTIGFQAVYPLA